MFLFANISFARLAAYIDCISLDIKYQEMTIECTYVQYTRAHMIGWFSSLSIVPVRVSSSSSPLQTRSQSLSVNSCILFFPPATFPCTLPLCVALSHTHTYTHSLSLSLSLSLSRSLAHSLSPISFPAPLHAHPGFQRENISNVWRAIHALTADAIPCAVKLTLPFIKPLVSFGLWGTNFIHQ